MKRIAFLLEVGSELSVSDSANDINLHLDDERKGWISTRDGG